MGKSEQQKKTSKKNNDKLSNGEKENRQVLFIATHRLFHHPLGQNKVEGIVVNYWSKMERTQSN